MYGSLVECTSLCKGFRCDRRPSALKIKRKGSEKEIWCTEIDDECDGPWCKFGICSERKMTSDGKCKGRERAPLKPLRKTVLRDEYDESVIEGVPKKYSKKIRDRSMR